MRKHIHGDPSSQCTDDNCRHVNDRFRHARNCSPDPSVSCEEVEAAWQKSRPQKGFRITSIYAYVAVDPEDGDEGIMAFESRFGMMPMIAADEHRLTEIRSTAEAAAKQFGIEVRLVRFDQRTTVEILNEKGTSNG